MEKILLVILLMSSLVTMIISLVSLFLVLKVRKKEKDDSSSQVVEERIKSIINTSLASISSDSISKTSEMIQKQIDNDNRRLNEYSAIINSKMEQTISTINDKFLNLTNTQNNTMNSFKDSVDQRLFDSMSKIETNLNEKLNNISSKVDVSLKDGFVQTRDSMLSLEKQLTVVKEAQKNIDDLQKNIVSLGNILTNNQERGRYGEIQLEMIMADIFGETKGTFYDYQFCIKEDGENKLRPDAVVFLDYKEKKMIVPIDSKFSLTGYEKLFSKDPSVTEFEISECKKQFTTALKKRIDETSKYIDTPVTISNSIMFIPSDSIFSYIMNEIPSVSDYARKKRVLITSPTILPPLLVSLKIVILEERKKDNLKKIDDALVLLSEDFRRFSERWSKIENNISTLSKSTNDMSTTVNKISKKFDNIEQLQFTDNEKE